VKRNKDKTSHMKSIAVGFGEYFDLVTD
jgi:hypothetical protein